MWINKILLGIKTNKKLLENISYLTIFQVLNLLMPMLLYPFLIKYIGLEMYGLIAFSQSLILFLSIIINYGFNIYSTKEIAVNKNDKIKISEIVSTTLLVKILLLFSVFFILTIIIISIPSLRYYWYIYVLSSGILIYEAIVPIWYFQGLELMKFIPALNAISKIFPGILILLFINSTNDYWKVPMIYSIGFLISSILSIYIVFVAHKIKYIYPNINNIKEYLIKSLPFFIALLARDSYIRLTPIIIGMFIGLKEVTYYDLGNKFLSALKSLISIVGQAMFPKVIKEKNKTFVLKIFFVLFIVIVFTVISLIINSEYITTIFIRVNDINAISIFNILVATSVFSLISNFASQQILVPFGYNKIYTIGIISSALLYLMMVVFFVITKMNTAIYYTYVVILVEFYLASYFSYFSYMKVLSKP